MLLGASGVGDRAIERGQSTADLNQRIWEVDFYRRPITDTAGQPLWELVVCDRARTFVFRDVCPQGLVDTEWLVDRLETALGEPSQLPDRLCVFRPQSLSLVEAAAHRLGWVVEPTRRTYALKHWLQQRSIESPLLDPATREPYDPLAIDQPPPLPLADALWGDRWGFTSLRADVLADRLMQRPIPFGSCPPELRPAALGLAASAVIPGVIVNGGRRSRQLAQWLDQVNPVTLNFVPGEPDGCILDAGLCDRWILTTSQDPEIRQAGIAFEARKAPVQNLHFLLLQPDDSGMTYTGLWLLQPA